MPAAPKPTSSTGSGTVRPTWPPDPPERPARARKWVKGGAAALTFVFAVTGAVTGLISFVRSEEVDVTVSARQTTFDRRSIDIGVVNSSQRAVSITAGTLTFGGDTVGRVARLVPSLGAADPRSAAERLVGASRLPFALAPGQAFAGTVEWVQPNQTFSLDALQRLDEYIGRPRSGDDRPDDRFKLVLDLEPGDDQEVPIRVSLDELDEGRTQVGHALGWHTQLVLDPRDRTVRSLSLYALDPGPNVASLEVWGRAAEPIHTATRPVVSSDRTSFELPAGMGLGEYSWAATVGGETVAVGRFRSPCPPGSSASNRYHEVASETCARNDRGGP